MPLRTVKANTNGAELPTNKAKQKGGKPSPATVLKLEEAIKLITDGKSRETVTQYFIDKYGYSRDQAYRYYLAATRMLVPEDMDEYKRTMIQANIERLEKIIEMGMETNNLKAAKEAIAELNKMFQVTSGPMVAIRNDDENKTQEVLIKFGD